MKEDEDHSHSFYLKINLSSTNTVVLLTLSFSLSLSLRACCFLNSMGGGKLVGCFLLVLLPCVVFVFIPSESPTQLPQGGVNGQNNFFTANGYKEAFLLSVGGGR